jgi:hypothetical protein
MLVSCVFHHSKAQSFIFVIFLPLLSVYLLLVKTRDGETLEEVRSRKGSNRAALGNLHECLRELVGMIRLSGVARKGAPEIESKTKTEKKKGATKKKATPESKTSPSNKDVVDSISFDDLGSRKTGYEKEVGEAGAVDEDALQDELDGLDFGDDESSVDDDSVDLR